MHTTPGSGSAGNASNPDPRNPAEAPEQSKSLLGEKAETYLREGGNIEDEPDARDQQEAEESLRGDDAP
ncbi:MAG: hypothetical protein EOO12_14685 [Chitinophagaceae bacterium]|nr:MAG: hypothetical protein EOO12_14685 [Chitinophagaceae bacterium]